jgi:hypothetical protein
LAGQPPRNAHPVSISADQLRNALRLILVKEPPKSPSRPLFTPAALEALGRRLEAGLARARPDQDVTFAIDQHTRGVFGLEDTRVISGRVFFTGEWLHLIFGSVLGHDVADEGPAIDSYLPGRRDVRVGDPVILAAAGSGIYRAPGVDRADWLVFGPQALAIRPPAPPGRPQTPGPQTPLPQSTWPQAYPPQPYWPQIPGPQAYPPQPYWPQTPGPQSTWPQGYPPQPY